MKRLYTQIAIRSALITFGILPIVVHAASAPTSLKSFAELIVNILSGIVGVLFASLAVGILYGIVQYFANSDSEEKREKIKGYLLWAVIGIAVVFGMWGIFDILASTLGWGSVGIPLLRPPR